ncbi:hypothetical protein BGX27_000199 [Mortierella sp. AM989]|nr:hypothetical protein BGX27_000199 [Mortierella sp. AM989]
MTPIIRNPLDIPLIRTRISHYVTRKDAMACILVNKEWREDFMPSIWHTIDFNFQKQFIGVDRAILAKHGRHIRDIKHIKGIAQIDTIQDSSVARLTSISLAMDSSPRYQAYAYDILRRNITTLKNIQISKSYSGNSDPLFLFVDALSPSTGTKSTSVLCHLKLDGISMTRDAFSSLLRMSPALETIDMRNIVLTSNLITDMYQHPNVTHLIASINQVFKVDEQSNNAPSLFAHFPNLTIWSMWSASTSDLDVPVDAIKAEIIKRCPQLKTLSTSLSGSFVVDILTHGIDNLKGICFMHKCFTPLLTMGVLLHKDTLERIETHTTSTKFYESEHVHSIDNHFQEYGWTVQTMIHLCAHLKTIRIPLLEMNIEDIEKIGWTCTNLVELRIRIKGLDTAQKIDKVVELWLEGRSKKRQSTQDIAEADCLVNLTLEGRVARHLIKFDKLKEVWLGTRFYRVA